MTDSHLAVGHAGGSWSFQDQEPQEVVMNPIHIIRRLTVLLAGLAATIVASIITASAAFATMPPPEPALPPGLNKHPPLAPAHVHAALAGGMPGWQIALIAVGAAVVAAVIAVLIDRAWTARRHVTASAT
jgi:hypothetical protein